MTNSPTLVPSSPANQEDLHKTGLSGGATAGVVIGVLIGVGALILAGFLLWRRRRAADTEAGSGGRGGGIRSPRRKGSVLSRTGLLGGARPQSMSEANYDDPFNPPESTTLSNSVRHSIMFGGSSAAAGEATDTAGPLGYGGGQEAEVAGERRPSRPMVYDQRLNPSALFANHDNGSRVSMQDQQDYSRPLGVANPDFRYSFDSR